jgi:protein-tyrosine phosphatase
MSLIVSNLLVGDVHDAFNRALLSSRHVTHVLNVASELNIPTRINLCYAKHGISDDCDNSDMRDVLSDAVQFVSTALSNHGTVLVHCLEGKSRSVCVCIAYMVCTLRWEFDSAVAHVRMLRPQIDPYPLYLEQTRQFCYNFA